jgi:hypothetical protein
MAEYCQILSSFTVKLNNFRLRAKIITNFPDVDLDVDHLVIRMSKGVLFLVLGAKNAHVYRRPSGNAKGDAVTWCTGVDWQTACQELSA